MLTQSKLNIAEKMWTASGACKCVWACPRGVYGQRGNKSVTSSKDELLVKQEEFRSLAYNYYKKRKRIKIYKSLLLSLGCMALICPTASSDLASEVEVTLKGPQLWLRWHSLCFLFLTSDLKRHDVSRSSEKTEAERKSLVTNYTCVCHEP